MPIKIKPDQEELWVKAKAAPTKRQRDYNELKFSAVSIDEKRGAMCREIRALGKMEQQ